MSQEDRFAEKRAFQRFPVQWKLKYHVLSPDLFDRESSETTTLDVGDGGLGFIALETLDVSQLCAFALYVPNSNGQFIAVARIRWQKEFENQLITGAQWVCWEDEIDKKIIMRYAETSKQSRDESQEKTVWL